MSNRAYAPKRTLVRRVRRMFRRMWLFTRERLHATTISRWGWWPAKLPALLRPRGRPGPRKDPRVAYYLWHFPVLSQTFVQREIVALRKQGVSLEVFAEAPEDVPMLDERGRALVTTTRYLVPIDDQRLARYKRQFRRERLLTYWHVYLYVMSRRYGLTKTLKRDRAHFEQAVYLAGHLRDAGVDRVHSPWGDRAGFAAMLAAKLLDIPFSMQVRAHDLHDPSYHAALKEMLPSAEFVITNTLYNRPFIEALMSGTSRSPEIHTIYNGIDLAEFDPPERRPVTGTPTRILCVARLVEQKGLTDLLEACALLRDRSFSFMCEVIGGVEEPLYAAYWQRLKKMHSRLRLANRVTFRGTQPFAVVMDAYRAADVFVLPCVVARDGRRDITPNAVIEAMAMKLPVVSTPVSGVVEIVEDGTSGLLVPPGNPVALADAIERLTRDRALATRLGENARTRIEDRFNADRNVLSRLRLFSVSPKAAYTPAAKPPMPTPAAKPPMQTSWLGS